MAKMVGYFSNSNIGTRRCFTAPSLFHKIVPEGRSCNLAKQFTAGWEIRSIITFEALTQRQHDINKTFEFQIRWKYVLRGK